MEKHVLWQPWTGPGLEHLSLTKSSMGIIADGLIVGNKDTVPFRVHYRLRCDSAWRVKQVAISLMAESGEDINLHADGKGHWTDDSGAPLPVLDSCLDLDISATPFTNTIPLERLGLKPGESAVLPVVYIAVPEMDIQVSRHSYTCLESGNGGLYRYADEGLFPGFTADLRVDSDGLVIDYPGLFRRVWPG